MTSVYKCVFILVILTSAYCGQVAKALADEANEEIVAKVTDREGLENTVDGSKETVTGAAEAVAAVAKGTEDNAKDIADEVKGTIDDIKETTVGAKFTADVAKDGGSDAKDTTDSTKDIADGAKDTAVDKNVVNTPKNIPDADKAIAGQTTLPIDIEDTSSPQPTNNGSMTNGTSIFTKIKHFFKHDKYFNGLVYYLSKGLQTSAVFFILYKVFDQVFRLV